jgi:hypothetical protein
MAGTSLPDPELRALRRSAFMGGAVGGAVGTIVVLVIVWLICGCPLAGG